MREASHFQHEVLGEDQFGVGILGITLQIGSVGLLFELVNEHLLDGFSILGVLLLKRCSLLGSLLLFCFLLLLSFLFFASRVLSLVGTLAREHNVHAERAYSGSQTSQHRHAKNAHIKA